MVSKTFRITGGYEQKIILVSALRYAWGRHTYVPSSTCEIIAKHIDQLEPECAYIMTRDIRDYWTRDYDSSKYNVPTERGPSYGCDVQPFVDLLPKLDGAARPVLTDIEPHMAEPQPPVGYDRWDQVPEEVRYRWPVK